MLQATSEEHQALLAKYDDHEAKMIRASLDDQDLKHAVQTATKGKEAAERELADLKPRLKDALSKLAGATAECAELHQQVNREHDQMMSDTYM